jgi:hypothetical protein
MITIIRAKDIDNGNKFAGVGSPGIVIALKRNGAYAGDIQVQQLGLGRVV